MKKWILPALTVVTFASSAAPLVAWAAPDPLSQEEAAALKIKDDPAWIQALKNQHHLGDEHIQYLLEKGLSFPEISMVSALSEKSGKTVDDILDMRNLKKMGWDKISAELEISSSEVSRSIASVRQEVEEEKSNAKKEAKRDELAIKKPASKQKG